MASKRPRSDLSKNRGQADPSGRQPDLLLDRLRSNSTTREPRSTDPEVSWTAPEAPRRSIVLAALLILPLLAIGILVAYKFATSSPPSVTPPSATDSPLPPNFMETSSAAEVRASTEAAIRGFMNATTDPERCQFVLGGTQVISRMAEFHRRPESPSPLGFGSLLDVGLAAFSGIPIQVASVSEANQQVGWSFILLPLRDRMVIDWEASVAYGTLSWPDFRGNQPPQAADMRVYLKRLYPPDPDPSLHFYEVSARAENETATATVKATTPLATLLTAIAPPGASQPVHARLQWRPHDASTPTLEIIDLLHNFWIDADRWKATLLSEK